MTDNNLDNFMNSDRWKEYEKKMQEKRMFLKQGSNVVHLQYFGSLFDKNDFDLFEEKLNNVDLQFSRYDQQGDVTANYELYELKVYIAVATPIIYELLKGIGSNAVWEAIKFLLLAGWKKTKNKFGYKVQSNSIQKNEMNFGLKISLDNNTSFNFHLDGNIDEDTFLKSLDMIFEFLHKQSLKSKYHIPDFVYFDNNKNEWVKIDVEEEIRKDIEKKSD